MALTFVVIYNWPHYVESAGTAASGVITQKLETVRSHYGDWTRRFQIIADFSVPGEAMERRAICDVDQPTYDSLHDGGAVTVHYFPALLNQPLLPATHLSPCSPVASLNLNAPFFRALLSAAAVLVLILFLWRALRIRIAAWLLAPWAAVSFVFLFLPRAEPVPTQPRPATATVGQLADVNYLLEGNEEHGIPLQHPYQIVEFRFSPPGMDTPVIGIDKIDLGSIPNLHKEQTVNIVYDAAQPRIAQLEGGSRSFPQHALFTMLLAAAAFVAFFIVVFLIAWIPRRLFRGAFRRR